MYSWSFEIKSQHLCGYEPVLMEFSAQGWWCVLQREKTKIKWMKGSSLWTDTRGVKSSSKETKKTNLYSWSFEINIATFVWLWTDIHEIFSSRLVVNSSIFSHSILSSFSFSHSRLYSFSYSLWTLPITHWNRGEKKNITWWGRFWAKKWIYKILTPQQSRDIGIISMHC